MRLVNNNILIIKTLDRYLQIVCATVKNTVNVNLICGLKENEEPLQSKGATIKNEKV